MTGNNSLAYLLCQEQKKRATADVRVVANRKPNILKISLVVATLILTGFGVWVASSSHAQVEAATLADRIDPSQMMSNAHDLPTTDFIDYTFHFPSRNN